MSRDALLTAKKRLSEFELDESLMIAHAEAMFCRDCEEHVQHGLEAFSWVELVAHQAERGERFSNLSVDELRLVVAQLFVDWLKRAEQAKGWVDKCTGIGFTIENTSKLLACIDSAHDWIESYDLQMIASRSFED